MGLYYKVVYIEICEMSDVEKRSQHMMWSKHYVPHHKIVTWTLLSKHGTSIQRYFNAGPPSSTLDQH